MVMFESEADVLKVIDEHDTLVRECVSGEIDFQEFIEKYGNFYWRYALDGHESDEEELALLQKHDTRIEPHRVIAFEILGQICFDEDALRMDYKEAGRFGSKQAVERLRQVRFKISR